MWLGRMRRQVLCALLLLTVLSTRAEVVKHRREVEEPLQDPTPPYEGPRNKSKRGGVHNVNSLLEESAVEGCWPGTMMRLRGQVRSLMHNLQLNTKEHYISMAIIAAAVFVGGVVIGSCTAFLLHRRKNANKDCTSP